MRHRKRGRRLGRSSSHRRALLRNLASSLFLTERHAEDEEHPPKVPGRITTTLQKAKEVRPLVEKCITIARRSLKHQENAKQFATDAERGDDEWREWRNGDQWIQWCEARSPVVAARRRAVKLLGDKDAVRILFDEVAPRMADRDGGYTRILRLATPRVGDAGTRAILEFVGQRDRAEQQSEKPEFGDLEEELFEEAEEEGQDASATEELEKETEDGARRGEASDEPSAGDDSAEGDDANPRQEDGSS